MAEIEGTRIDMMRKEFATKDGLEGFLVELDLMGGYIVHRIECRKGAYVAHYSKGNANDIF